MHLAGEPRGPDPESSDALSHMNMNMNMSNESLSCEHASVDAVARAAVAKGTAVVSDEILGCEHRAPILCCAVR